MGLKFYSTNTVALSSGDNAIIAAPAPPADGLGAREHFIRKLTAQNTGSTAVTLIIKNDATPARELEQRWVLDDKTPALYLQFDNLTEIGVGDGGALIVNASAAGVNLRVEYRTGAALAWPA